MNTSKSNLTVYLLLACLMVGVWFGVDWYVKYRVRMSDGYAAMRVGILITNHLNARGQWPHGWADLEKQYAKHMEAGWEDETLAELQNRVTVDWTVTLDTLAGAQSHVSPPFPVVRCVSGNPPGPSAEHDANHIIFKFLNGSR